MRRIADAVMWAGMTDFESYYRALQRRTGLGGPSFEEAKRDYLSSFRYRYLGV